MPFDIEAIRPDVSARLMRVGQGYPSEVVLAQIAKTLAAYGVYGARLALHGFAVDDQAQLVEVQALIRSALASREGARGDHKAHGVEARRARRAGASSRLQLRSVLRGTLDAGHRQGASVEFETAIDTALRLTVRAEKDPHALATQLDTLVTALRRSDVAALAAPRGATEAIAAAEAAQAALRAGDVVSPAGSTERLDVLDGLAIGICRAAYSAAKSASRQNRERAIADAFSLDALYADTHPTPVTLPPSA